MRNKLITWIATKLGVIDTRGGIRKPVARQIRRNQILREIRNVSTTDQLDEAYRSVRGYAREYKWNTATQAHINEFYNELEKRAIHIQHSKVQ